MKLDSKPSYRVSPVKTCGRNCPTRIMSNLFCPDKAQPAQGEQKDNKTAPHININIAVSKLLNYQISIFFLDILEDTSYAIKSKKFFLIY